MKHKLGKILTTLLIIILIIGIASFIVSRGKDVSDTAIQAAENEIDMLVGTVHDVEVEKEQFDGKKCYQITFECMDSNNNQIEVEVFMDMDSREVLSITTANDD